MGGQRSGRGTYRWANGRSLAVVYRLTDSMYCICTVYVSIMFVYIGDVYEGAWAADDRSGEGVMTYVNGKGQISVFMFCIFFLHTTYFLMFVFR